MYQNILIVDDSETSRMIIKRCFEMAGYQDCTYYQAEDGLKALMHLQQLKADLVVTDLKMPKMDGHTFIRKLKIDEKMKDIPILVISSMGNEVVENDLKKIGVMAIIRKPLSPAKVIEALGE